MSTWNRIILPLGAILNIVLPIYGALIAAGIVVLLWGIPGFYSALPKFKKKQKKAKPSEYTGMGSVHDAY